MRKLAIGPFSARLGTLLGSLLLVALPGCALFGGGKPTAADADSAYAKKDLVALADLCVNTQHGEASKKACKNLFLVEAAAQEAMYAGGDLAQIKGICEEKIERDKHPTTGAKLVYDVSWSDVSGSLPGKLASMTDGFSNKANARYLACTIDKYARVWISS